LPGTADGSVGVGSMNEVGGVGLKVCVGVVSSIWSGLGWSGWKLWHAERLIMHRARVIAPMKARAVLLLAVLRIMGSTNRCSQNCDIETYPFWLTAGLPAILWGSGLWTAID